MTHWGLTVECEWNPMNMFFWVWNDSCLLKTKCLFEGFHCGLAPWNSLAEMLRAYRNARKSKQGAALANQNANSIRLSMQEPHRWWWRLQWSSSSRQRWETEGGRGTAPSPPRSGGRHSACTTSCRVLGTAYRSKRLPVPQLSSPSVLMHDILLAHISPRTTFWAAVNWVQFAVHSLCTNSSREQNRHSLSGTIMGFYLGFGFLFQFLEGFNLCFLLPSWQACYSRKTSNFEPIYVFIGNLMSLVKWDKVFWMLCAMSWDNSMWLTP